MSTSIFLHQLYNLGTLINIYHGDFVLCTLVYESLFHVKKLSDQVHTKIVCEKCSKLWGIVNNELFFFFSRVLCTHVKWIHPQPWHLEKAKNVKADRSDKVQVLVCMYKKLSPRETSIHRRNVSSHQLGILDA